MQPEQEPTVATLRSGDILIVGHRRGPLSAAEADRYRATVLDRIPGLANVVLLTDVAALAAYRPDEVKASDAEASPALTLEALLAKLGWSREYAEHLAFSGCQLCRDSPVGGYWCAQGRS